jgi:hypothetical protein
MTGTCPNCGSYFRCDCTWDEMQRAVEIHRRKMREARRKIGKPTVVEREAEERRNAAKARPTR